MVYVVSAAQTDMPARCFLQVDLLVSTAQLRCIGYLRDPISVLPCVGSESDGKKWIPATELQLYGRPEYDWIVLQQRAPAALGK